MRWAWGVLLWATTICLSIAAAGGLMSWKP